MLNTLVMVQDGKTALMIAAEFGRTEVVLELAKAGADLNLQDSVSLCLSYFLRCMLLYYFSNVAYLEIHSVPKTFFSTYHSQSELATYPIYREETQH